MNAFQQALLATIMTIAPPATSVSQQAVSASTPMISVHLLPPSMTDNGSQLTAGLESDMEVHHSDFGVDVGKVAGHGAAELQPEPQLENRTTTETTKSKKPASQKSVPKVTKDKSGHTSRPKKPMRISEGETTTLAAAEPANLR